MSCEFCKKASVLENHIGTCDDIYDTIYEIMADHLREDHCECRDEEGE